MCPRVLNTRYALVVHRLAPLVALAIACHPQQPAQHGPSGGVVSADDADRDHDMIADRCDQCPDDPENYNGRSDLDGCPDRDVFYVGQTFGPWGVTFGSGGVTPEADPAEALDQIVKDDASAWDFGIEIQGCTGSDEAPELGAKRAAWMKEQLLKRNVSSARVRIAADPCDKQLPHQHCALARPIVAKPQTVGCPTRTPH